MKSSGIDEDRKLISASIPELDEYLNSQVMFWRIPRLNLMLTPGNLLLALLRTSREQERELIRAREFIDALTFKRRIAWEQKALKEIPVRLNQWNGYVQDYREGGTVDSNFIYAVRVRVILGLLISAVQFVPLEFVTVLEGLDQQLELLADRGTFLWAMEFALLFPESSYPFLYLHPKGE